MSESIEALGAPGLSAAPEHRATRSRSVLRSGYTRIAMPIAFALVLGTLGPEVIPATKLLLATQMLVFATAAIGMNVMFGMAGLVSLAVAAEMGLAAYTCALLGIHLEWDFTLTLVTAVAVGAAVSAITGLLAIRLRSHYFILVTLAVAEIIGLVLLNEASLTGGANGLGGIPTLKVAGADLPGPVPMFVVSAVVLAAALYVAGSVQRSRLGRAMSISAKSEHIASASGVNHASVWIASTAIGGSLAGAAGALFAQLTQFLGPGQFDLNLALLLILMVLVGGLGSNVGTVVGAALLTYLANGLPQLNALGPLIYGFGVMALLVLLPDGIAGMARRTARAAWRNQSISKLLRPLLATGRNEDR